MRKALALLDGAKEPRLLLCAEHDLARFLNDAGRSEEALVVLDLAQVLVAKGEGARAVELVVGCYPIMKSWGIHKEALAVWLLFRDALATGAMDEIFERIGDYYRRHWFVPARFEGRVS